MELKDANSLYTSAEIGVTPISGENNTNKHRVYDVLFSPKDESNPYIENNKNNNNKGDGKLIFSGNSTLEWLRTWRPLEET